MLIRIGKAHPVGLDDLQLVTIDPEPEHRQPRHVDYSKTIGLSGLERNRGVHVETWEVLTLVGDVEYCRVWGAQNSRVISSSTCFNGSERDTYREWVRRQWD